MSSAHEMNRPSSILCGLAMLTMVCAPGRADVPAQVEFNRDVRPILSDKCFRCHGPDAQARKADLRLDLSDAAFADHEGVRAIVPGKPDDSDVMRRVLSADEDEKMPPPKSHLQLTPGEIAVLRQWIAQGAEYQPHWSFVPPVAARPPQAGSAAWRCNEVDHFVLAALEAGGLKPSPEADKTTILRRVTLDLTGLPPTLAELDAFVQDASPGGYERVVDRLLASPRFGERMAVDWLDAARYADTNGYFGDKTRSAWPWRDWVIRAFNGNMPFDQFTVEQIAGDLLPDATVEQRIATGFNRNSMANNESGVIDEEYRVESIVDRLDATATTWMGLTLGCAQCHDHKYDPVTQKEFYQLFAFFNSTPEKGLIKDESPPPVMQVPSPRDERELIRLGEARSLKQREFDRVAADLKAQIARWEGHADAELMPSPRDHLALHMGFEKEDTAAEGEAGSRGDVSHTRGVLGSAAKFDSTQHLEWTGELGMDAEQPWSVAVWVKGEGSLGCVMSKVEPVGNRRGWEMIWQKGRLQVNLVNVWGVSAIELSTSEPLDGQWHHIVLSYDGTRKAEGVTLMADGKRMSVTVQRDTLAGSIANAEPLRIGRRDAGLGFYGQLDELRLLRRTVNADEAEKWFWSERLRGILATPSAKRDAGERKVVQDYFVHRHATPEVRDAYDSLEQATVAEASLRTEIPTALVMQDLPVQRATHVLMRGQYDQPGNAVRPDVPAVFPPMPDGMPRNRLGFARWLVSERHPLTARVVVNRLWLQCFGEGIVRTTNDFGVQGEPPTHPELLDWLAVRFMRTGWDVKAMLRMIVTSATYRQSSASTPALQEHDPENRLLARGPRFRLSAEMLRDQALDLSGLLSKRMGGSSVMPHQPPGLWEAVSYNGEQTYVPDLGEGLWRRSLYTFWKRQAPPPGILTFDGPTREKCTVRRARTNTPLQALVLLNDQTYVEAARGLAAATLACSARDDEDRIREMFRRVAARWPGEDESKAISGLLRRQRNHFAMEPKSAESLRGTGASGAGVPSDGRELAAWTLVAQTLLNLDEIINRR